MRELWWVPLVRGLAAIAFGVLVLIWPAASISIVAILFAGLLAAYGILDIVNGFQGITRRPIGILQVLLGLLEMGIVIYLFRNAGSGLTLAIMGLLMAVAFIALGLVALGSAILNDASGGYRWVIGIIGVITIFVGISIARAPVISISGVIYALGIFGLFVGPLEIAAAFMLKNDKSTA